MDQLEAVTVEIGSHFESRQQWIDQLDEILTDAENDRVTKMSKVFERSWKILEKIAFLPAPDMQRMLDKDCQLINQVVLNNKRMYADLRKKLLYNNVDREHKLHIQWRKRVSAWKQLHIEKAISSFMTFMEGDEVLRSPRLSQLLQDLTAQQTDLNQQRLTLINSLREVSPPTLGVRFMKDWYQQLTDLSKKLDEVNQTYFSKLCLECEQICQTCLGEVMALKNDLINRRVCTEAEAGELINKRCLPVVGERQSCFEKTLEALDKAMEEQSASSLQLIKHLFKFGQAAGQLWDTHEISLARLEKVIQDKLDGVRLQHDAANQEREAALDVMMDRMRQEATDVALKEALGKAIQMLATIRHSYDEFYTQQLEIVTNYPQMTQSEVRVYAVNICSFFNVTRVEDSQDTGKAAQASPRPLSPTVQAIISKLVPEAFETVSGAKYTVITNTGVTKGQSGQRPSETRKISTAAPPPDVASPPASASATLSSEAISGFGDGFNASEAVKTIAIEDGLVTDVCAAVRLNLLNHVDSWSEESDRRSAAFVDAKTTELKSELELRIHLHEPRARRVELDVHNVRAAELAMHSERVSRHINGIEQSLVELRQIFRSMIDSHQQQMERFRDDVDRFDQQFASAAKSSRLVELMGELRKKQTILLAEIRDAVDRFNGHIRSNVAVLLNSTSQFLQSFKLFSDGGNFCTAEIAEYSKRLERATQKIDAMEQQLYAELKTVEPKMLEESSKIVQSFEDRFQNDMADLTFVEKVARWLTNCQVKIKSEVADSNGQSLNIARSLSQLERLLIGCETPSLDAGFVKPNEVVAALGPLFDLVSQRCQYLQCLIPPNSVKIVPASVTATTEQTAAAAAATSAPTAATTNGDEEPAAKIPIDSGIPPISKPGVKGLADDASVVTIQQILKTQKLATDKERVDGEAGMKSDCTDSVALQSRNSNATTRKQSKQLTGRESRQQKGADSAGVKKRNQPGKTAGGGKNKVDPKYFVFGETAEPGEENHFKGRVKIIARDTLSAILATAEAAYKLKGPRPTTKPDQMQDSLEQCAEIVIQKLQSYVAQSDDYHNTCVHEFRQQLDNLEALAQRVPRCVVQEVLSTALSESSAEQDCHTAQFDELKVHLDSLKESHDKTLRPALGHPEQLSTLSGLCQQEEDRQQQMTNAVADVTKKRKDTLAERRRLFVDALLSSTKQQLLLFDQMIVTKDVIAAKIDPVKHTPCELMRRKKSGRALDDEQPVESTEDRGPVTWPELLASDPFQPTPTTSSHGSVASKKTTKKSSSKQLQQQQQSNAVTTMKSTAAHRACVTARDEAYEGFKNYLEATLQKIDSENERLSLAETRWTQRWRTAVDKMTSAKALTLHPRLRAAGALRLQQVFVTKDNFVHK